MKKEIDKSIRLCLFNIRSAHNVGSIFRTADASGVKEIFLVGTTPSPIDRFGRKRTDIAKVSLGAEKLVAFRYLKSWKEFKKISQDSKFTLVALEQNKKSIDYKKFSLIENTCLILGEEVKGIPERILNDCSQIIEIPMRGKKESLNVSVATGVALFRILGI